MDCAAESEGLQNESVDVPRAAQLPPDQVLLNLLTDIAEIREIVDNLELVRHAWVRVLSTKREFHTTAEIDGPAQRAFVRAIFPKQQQLAAISEINFRTDSHCPISAKIYLHTSRK